MTGFGCALAIGSVVLMYGGSGGSRLTSYAEGGVWFGIALGLSGLLVAVSALLLMAWSALFSRGDRSIPATRPGAEAEGRRASVGGDALCPHCGGLRVRLSPGDWQRHLRAISVTPKDTS